MAASRAGIPGEGETDALLAQRLAAGDDHALAEIFDRLAPAVYATALGVTGQGAAAQDVVQDVFVALWSHPDRYDPAAAQRGLWPRLLLGNAGSAASRPRIPRSSV